ncbi:MAG: hypothetical protein ACYC0H_23445, partial [Solirubrobacteraceae bacterium]
MPIYLGALAISSNPDAPPILDQPARSAGRRSVSDPRRALTASAELCARLVFAGIAAYAAIDTALVFLRPQFSLLHNAESDYGSRGSWAWV